VSRGAHRLGALLGAVALLVLTGPLTLLGAGPAGAAGEEHISAYDVTLDVRADGSLGVREQAAGGAAGVGRAAAVAAGRGERRTAQSP
jgi:hypothetical protein